MRAILIDPVEKKITEVDYTGPYTQIYEFIHADMFECVYLDNGDAIFVDEEGLLRNRVKPFFKWTTYPQPIAGYGLILGHDEDGESVSPKTTLEEAVANVKWMDALGAFRLAVAEGPNGQSGGNVKIPPHEYTEGEARTLFLSSVRSIVDYWSRLRPVTKEEAVAGAVSSILGIFDGLSAPLPRFMVCPWPHPDDQRYHKERGENWFADPGSMASIICDISGRLQDEFNNL